VRSFNDWACDRRFAAALYVTDSPSKADHFQFIWGACNSDEAEHDDLAHAEMKVLGAAHRVLFDRKEGEEFHLFVSAESCTMCISAIHKAHIDHVYYAPVASSKSMIPPIEVAEVVKRSHQTIDDLRLPKTKIQIQYCPVRSRIESTGYAGQVNRLGSRMLGVPVEWAFSRKERC
jgi:tRNA(Arg) A34 adenosine deaminase TadA